MALMTLPISVRRLSRPAMWTPLKYALISDMPEPAACGAQNATMAPATSAYAAEMPTYMQYGAQKPPA